MDTDVAWVMTLAAAVASGTPLLYAALGTLMAERVGVANLGVEGMMLIGAVVSVIAFSFTGSAEVAFLCSGLGGLVCAVLLTVIIIPFRTNQIVTGLALTFLLTGVAILMGSSSAGRAQISAPDEIAIPILSDIPVLGVMLFNQDVYVYLSWLLAGGLSIFYFRTRPGMTARSLGDNPQAAASLGVRVNLTRAVHVSVGGILIGMGGGYIAVSILGYWTGAATVAGQGWIAIALVIVAAWRPLRLIGAAFLFGLIVEANFALQAAGITGIPGSILAMLPYLITIGLLTVLSITKSRTLGKVPAALGVPFVQGERQIQP
jgi:simple sugar transport system permease protein